ncbi:DUF134 domain-containing protein [Candidatus Harpocratesius sp.]
MGRPHKYRKISNIVPKFNNYHPKGINSQDVNQIFLSMEEFEALRLRYYEDLKQTDAAQKMQISQTTFSRILSKAYRKITKALVEGYGIAIQTEIMPLPIQPILPISSIPPRYGRRRHGRAFHSIENFPQRGSSKPLGNNSFKVDQDKSFQLDQTPNWIPRPTDPKSQEMQVIVFKGWGCLNCGFVFQTSTQSDENLIERNDKKVGEFAEERNYKDHKNLEKKEISSSQSLTTKQKPICPKCNSKKTYQLIKKLSPD